MHLDATTVAFAAFLTFLGLLVVLKVPALVAKMLDDQGAKVSNELAEAKRLREEAEALRAQYDGERAKAEAEAAAIVAKAHEDAARFQAESAAQLDKALATRARQAEDRIRRAEEQALADVRAASGAAAVAVAEQLLVGAGKGKAGDKLFSDGVKAVSGAFN
jgi:F-type H+-transporting ATPase subunit b